MLPGHLFATRRLLLSRGLLFPCLFLDWFSHGLTPLLVEILSVIIGRGSCVLKDLPRKNCLVGMLKKAASGVLALLPCSRTPSVRSAHQKGCGLARGNGTSWRAGVGRVRKRTFLNIPMKSGCQRVRQPYGWVGNRSIPDHVGRSVLSCIPECCGREFLFPQDVVFSRFH